MFRRFLVVLLLAAATLVGGAPAQAAPVIVPVTGVGSTWSANAIDEWRRGVAQYNWTINYDPLGSSKGRSYFAEGQSDFGVSEIPYGITDEGTGVADPPPSRAFVYMPIVAGGTSFMYNLKIGNNRVTNLRLSGETVAKIFTGVITSWDDKQIAEDNPELKLPARPIVPVYRSDGSGTTAQFTLWMSKEYPNLWHAFCKRAKRSENCGLTSQFPPGIIGTGAGGSAEAAGFVKQSSSEGAITYVEYSYAVQNEFPVAKIRNKSNYFIEPTADAVAVALLKAVIRPDLTQDLDGVYHNEDKRSYPLSSYSYMILPTKIERGLDENKGYSIARFGKYLLCEGQQKADILGYSPLPINLVRSGLEQVRKVPGAIQEDTDIKTCNNPTFSSTSPNKLAETAPQPPDCDQVGRTQCATGTGGLRKDTAKKKVTTQGTAGPVAAGTASGGAVDGSGGDGVSDVEASPVSLEADGGWRLRHTMMLLAAVLLIAVIVGPPLLSRRMRRGEDR
ncbi:phosphate ABC transporter substrate-binding protein PstS [Longispora fulva]|uniref:Phosphate transport system substrate-binding protein n=1 Tax=Longispora fulva TaxID=619741 RepID=A0A8J7GRL3_9ACTN|nr:phosphate ABC transporter substrate-binding protein PstS [Longispora fulva]MBG6137429.1 phosphate transport system substrate-binding protein [Longispora fulva]GIG61216.1 phosphate ABC transporter substrate-binding protein PstS [Longispora fulva]